MGHRGIGNVMFQWVRILPLVSDLIRALLSTVNVPRPGAGTMSVPAEAESDDPLGAEKHDSDPGKTKMNDDEMEDMGDGACGKDSDKREINIKELNEKLLEAAKAGEEDIVNTLLSEGADPNYKDEERGNTAGHYAAREGHNGVLKILLEKGLDKDIRGDSKFTPLIIAAAKGHPSTVKMLGSIGADLNLRAGDKGLTALMVAALYGHLETVAELLVLGADIKLQYKDGHTAQQIAKDDTATVLQSWQKPEVRKKNMMKAEKSGNVDLARALAIIGVVRNIPEEQLEELAQQLERNEKLLEAVIKGMMIVLTHFSLKVQILITKLEMVIQQVIMQPGEVTMVF